MDRGAQFLTMVSMTAASLVLLSYVLASRPAAAASPQRDVLFIAVDDLRPSLSVYGDPSIKTPHLAALAERSLVFDRMYTAVSVCAPARTAIMVGRRPVRATTQRPPLKHHCCSHSLAFPLSSFA